MQVGMIARVVGTLGILAVVIGFSGTLAVAQSSLNATPEGVAVDGFDVLAYFADGAPREGLAAYSVRYLDRDWHFATAEHAALFAANPAKYAPQSTSYCSHALSEGYTAEVDVIDGWTIIGGKLYLNWSRDVRDVFLAKQDTRVAKVAQNWPALLAGLADGTTRFYPHSSDASVQISHPQKLP